MLRLVWERDGGHWPHREASSFVQAAQLRWHVQSMEQAGAGTPIVWLIHGTGASTHSWRGLMPLLASQCRVFAADLPGHGFTSMPDEAAAARQFSLPGMAQALYALMRQRDALPDLLVAHSAGAAIAARMCLDGLVRPAAIVSLNGAYLPLGGVAGRLFSPAAKLMAASRLVPRLFAWRATDPAMVQRLLSGTGSVLDPSGVALYGKLVRNPGHAAAALAMMAHWDLLPLQEDLRRLATPVCLAVGSNDQTIAPAQAHRVLARLPAHPLTRVEALAGLGHLAHEEQAATVAGLVLGVAQATRLLPQA